MPLTGERLTCTLKRFMNTLMQRRFSLPKGSVFAPIRITLPSAGLTARPGAWGITLSGSRKNQSEYKKPIQKIVAIGQQPMMEKISAENAQIPIAGTPSGAIPVRGLVIFSGFRR